MIHPSIIQAFINTGYQLFILNQKRFLRLQKELEIFLHQHQLTIDKKLLKRINFYLMQSTITNFWFGMMRGYKPTKDETLAGIYAGACTPFYDDLIDNEGFDHAGIAHLQQTLNTSKTEYALMYFLYNKLLLHLPPENNFLQYFELNGKVQTMSLDQLNKAPLESYELLKLTQDKGGYATLLYRSIMQHPLRDGEEKCIYMLGASLQLLNDLFDLYKDHQQGIQTLFTKAPHVPAMQLLFRDQVTKSLEAIDKCDYDTVQKKKLLPYIKIIWSRGFVFLEQLSKLPQANEHFSIDNYTRQQLICDMEKPRNIWRSMQLAATI